MLELIYPGNLFLLPTNLHEAGVVTTNGIVKQDGRLVMGAGIAKYCRDNHAFIDQQLGHLVKESGNHAYYTGPYFDDNRFAKQMYPWVAVISMPTKHHFRDKSDINLIKQSCSEMMKIADTLHLIRIYMPTPGCNLGQLDYTSEVKPVISSILDDRFIVCI